MVFLKAGVVLSSNDHQGLPLKLKTTDPGICAGENQLKNFSKTVMSSESTLF